jgi:hypothetical protein
MNKLLSKRNSMHQTASALPPLKGGLVEGWFGSMLSLIGGSPPASANEGILRRWGRRRFLLFFLTPSEPSSSSPSSSSLNPFCFSLEIIRRDWERLDIWVAEVAPEMYAFWGFLMNVAQKPKIKTKNIATPNTIAISIPAPPPNTPPIGAPPGNSVVGDGAVT